MDVAFPAMESYRGISIIVGALYIFGLVAGILSVAHAVDDSDYLTKAAPNARRINRAACFQFLMAFSYIGIAIVLYPMLTIFHEILAVGFLSFRIAAVLLVLAGTVILLLILKLSREYVKGAAADPSIFSVAGNLLKTARDLVNHVGMIIMLCMGGILLYIIMIQSGLIPLWLSVWGLLGYSLAILASMLVMVNCLKILSPAYLILNLPIALQEIVFAGWLILKGFKQV